MDFCKVELELSLEEAWLSLQHRLVDRNNNDIDFNCPGFESQLSHLLYANGNILNTFLNFSLYIYCLSKNEKKWSDNSTSIFSY
jgi:hypothetical protein